MSRKWVEKEAPLWIERGIVTREQVNQILHLYEDKKHAVGLLPILGSILLGLGILSFIAANWQDIPQLLRLGMVIAVMAGFYVAGEKLVRRGSDKLGISLVALGVVTFGAGMILIGQMFHLMAYNAGTFIMWSAAGALAAYLYNSRYLYLLSLLLVNVAGWYSVNEFDTFSYTAFGLLVPVLGAYVWKRRSNLLIWLFSFSVTLHLLMWTTSGHIPFLWMFVPAMALYVLGDWLVQQRGGYALQVAPLTAAFLFSVFMVLFPGEWNGRMMEELRPEPLYYIGAMMILFAVSITGKMKNGRASSAFEWILLVPFIYMPSGIDVLYLVSLFIFSLYVLWSGYAEEWRFKINFGTMLFICSTLVAYGKLTWDFMDKSLFFIIGGMILLGLSWFLNRRKKQVLEDAKEGNRHE